MLTRRGVAVTVDAAGNITSDGVRGYTYNEAGQLSQLRKANVLLASYDYDERGLRIRKVTTVAAPQGAQTVLYSYDEAGHLLEESTATGAPLRTYVWRDEVPLAQIEHTPVRRILYFDTDQLNTPRAARDQSGNVVWRWESDAFGSTAPNENPYGAGVTTVNLRFPGQYYDAESGLHYNGHRYYDPGTGMYTQSDPIGLNGGSFSTYTYVGGNPLRYGDPRGTDPIIGVSVGVVAGAIQGYMGAVAQNGSPSDRIVGAVIGGGLGAIVGFLDPSLGAGTLAIIGATAGVVGDIAGQEISIHNDPCKKFNIGSSVGAAIAGGFAGYGAAVLSPWNAIIGEWTTSVVSNAMFTVPTVYLPTMGASIVDQK